MSGVPRLQRARFWGFVLGIVLVLVLFFCIF